MVVDTKEKIIKFRVDTKEYAKLKEIAGKDISKYIRSKLFSNEPVRIEKQATAEPKEPIKQQKTSPLFIDKEICPYYIEQTSGCKVSIPVGQYVECAGSLLKCPKKA